MEEFDPHVDPIEVIDRGEGKSDVRVHQQGLCFLYRKTQPRGWVFLVSWICLG